MEKFVKTLATSNFTQDLIQEVTLKRNPQWEEKETQKYTENLVTSVSKSVYQTAFIKSLIKEDDEPGPLMDPDDKIREERLGTFRKFSLNLFREFTKEMGA